nr:MAG TPA: hypothetical protein [Bacteriophage sp.]
MLSKERIKELKELLTTTCGNITYIPEMYLKNEVVPQLVIVYVIFGKRYNFTIPAYLFEEAIHLDEYKKVSEDFINEVIRNVELAHKREELIR